MGGIPLETTIGVGLDLVEVARIERAALRWGRAFLDRVFTPGEMADVGRGRRAERLAARFAAKEAVFKALGRGRPGGGQPGLGWREVEVIKAETGRPGIILSGRALARARELGVTRVLLSLTHTAELAAAQVICLGEGGLGTGPTSIGPAPAEPGLEAP
jgi:holo-[acyl-carrier protein] synthase